MKTAGRETEESEREERERERGSLTEVLLHHGDI